MFLWDEKVSSVQVFRKQRTRWIESQLIHISLFFKDAKSLDFGRLNVINKFISNLFPPRVVLLGILFLINVIALLPIGGTVAPGRLWWLFLFVTYLFALLISVPKRFFTFRSLKAVLFLPLAFMNMMLAFLKVNPSRKEFVHTPKSYNEKSGPI